MDNKLKEIHINKTKSSSCKDCGEREPGCHDKCQEYASFKKELEEEKKLNS